MEQEEVSEGLIVRCRFAATLTTVPLFTISFPFTELDFTAEFALFTRITTGFIY